jgi:hypothetical protein
MVFDFYLIKCVSRTFLHLTSRNAPELTSASLRGIRQISQPVFVMEATLQRAKRVGAIQKRARYYGHESINRLQPIAVLQF